MHRIFLMLVCYMIVIVTHCAGQVQDLPAAFNAISDTPELLSFVNPMEISIKGGHIQGAQWLLHKDTAYVVLTGSSNDAAYCATAQLGDHPRLINIHTLMKAPFRHAGGFQICGDLMAIGIEDNRQKNRSKVVIYRILDPVAPFYNPLVTIERQGAPERSTAGCVGIARDKNTYTVAVGDWDTKHLDFYTCSSTEPLSQNSRFAPVSTIDTESADRSRWVDDMWLAYQNINLFVDQREDMYLIGTATNYAGEDIADLYRLLREGDSVLNIRKVYSKNFGENREHRFRWGAGLSHSGTHGLMIVAAEEQIGDGGSILLYR